MIINGNQEKKIVAFITKSLNIKL